MSLGATSAARKLIALHASIVTQVGSAGLGQR